MKMLSRVFVILLVLCVLCSFGYAALESGHDCRGEDCPVCKVVALISSFFALISLTLFFSVVSRPVKSRVAPERTSADLVTPILLKVKLSN